MPLIFCPDCGTSVSDQAERCPKCSYPIKQLAKQELNIQVITKSSAMIWTGYAMAFISLLFWPFFFMLFGIIFGIVNITKNEVGHGIAQIILSIICGILGAFLGILTLLF